VAYLLVFVVAFAVGAAVYVSTVRAGAGRPDGGFGEGAEVAGAASREQGGPYLPVAADGPDWQSRITGVLGLVISVVVAGVALAVSIYALGALIGKLFGGISGDAGAPTG
jgi:hypothetical protein